MLPFMLFPVGQEFGNRPAGQFWLEPPMQLQVVAGVGASRSQLGAACCISLHGHPRPFHMTGLGLPKMWQPQISYMQLKAPKTSVPRESQMAAVTLFLTPSWKSHIIISLVLC